MPHDPATCESCGAFDGDLAPVRRVYISFDEEGSPVSTVESDDVEWWCVPCRALYPNIPAN